MLHQQLGLRPGNQHAAVNEEIEAVELSVAQDVGQRLAGLPPRQQCRELFPLCCRQRTLGMCQQPRPIPAQHVCQQQFGVKLRGVAAGKMQYA